MSEAAPHAISRSPVLVVEDEHHICALISDILESEGFAPCCVQSDREAYEELRRGERFACMLVDVNLRSGHTGYDVARFARRIDPALPVIYVSGESSQASFRANSVPGSLFVAKPFNARELMGELKKLVGDNDG